MAALLFTGPEPLRDHLNALRKSDYRATVVGIDDRNHPFLADLLFGEVRVTFSPVGMVFSQHQLCYPVVVMER